MFGGVASLLGHTGNLCTSEVSPEIACMMQQQHYNQQQSNRLAAQRQRAMAMQNQNASISSTFTTPQEVENPPTQEDVESVEVYCKLKLSKLYCSVELKEGRILVSHGTTFHPRGPFSTAQRFEPKVIAIGSNPAFVIEQINEFVKNGYRTPSEYQSYISLDKPRNKVPIPF